MRRDASGRAPAVRLTWRALALALIVLLSSAAAVVADDEAVVFTPNAAGPGTRVHAANLVWSCGEISPGLDFVRLFRREGVYTGDDLVFPAGSEVDHAPAVIEWSGLDGSFTVPDVPPGTYVVYLQCCERDLLQLVDGPGLAVLSPEGGVPPTDAADVPRPSSGPDWRTVTLAAAMVLGSLWSAAARRPRSAPRA